MEVDSPPSPGDILSPTARIIQRLTANGVSLEYLEAFPSGLVAFIQQNDACIPEVVSAILPTDSEAAEAIREEAIREAQEGCKKDMISPTLRDLYCESMVWLQWLMFREDPLHALENLERMSAGQSGICGAVWGKDDVAFRCRTCEHDPTCAICVTCFQKGNHKDHDFSIIYTGGGCCDCGDETAWKPEGFCARHRGAGMIQPLQDDIAQSVGPVLDALLDCWKSKLMAAESVSIESPGTTDHATDLRKVAIEFTFSVVEMLQEFCRRSESLLSFLSKRVIASVGLLDTLVSAERFLIDTVTKKLHELLLKLIGEPVFKFEFGKAIVNYYPVFVLEAVKACNDSVQKKYPLLSSFSVQILTVPTLTMRLVKEVNLLEVLLFCVGDILYCCLGHDGLLQISKWSNLFDTTIRLLEDVKFVMSHSEVAEYLKTEQQHIYSAWLRILSFLQGMNPQKRETSIHVEEENESVHLPFYLCSSIFNINSLLVARSFSATVVKEADNGSSESREQNLVHEPDQRLAKVGRMSQESSACTSTGSGGEFISRGSETNFDADAHLLVPAYMSLVDECLKAIDRWLITCNSSNVPPSGDSANSNRNLFKKALLKVRKGKYSFGLYDKHRGTGFQILQCDKQDFQPMDIDNSHDPVEGGCIMGGDSNVTSEYFQVLSLPDWRNINYDVSSSQISIHIPFHGLLSSILKEALRKYYAESAVQHSVALTSEDSLSSFNCFFGSILKGCQPNGFSSFMMEHPLQIRVFCAQVRAGMWKRNGDAATVSYDMYRSVQLSANTLELDLFLLQVCAAFAPPDLYARRILDRFGLLNYLSLDPLHSSEYEPVLVQEMLALIIQIVKERRYCGSNTSESMRRELICKLATGDATRSQLQKALPRDLSKLNLQEVLDSVAQYSNPSGMKQGRYSLRLSCWKELDLYHPRWSPRDLQVAEEKYLQFCGVSAMASQLPKWTKIYQPLIGVSRIATCKMVLEIIRSVIFYAVSDKAAQSRAPDGVLITALHLLSLGLDICTMQKESDQSLIEGDQIPLLAFAGEEITSGTSTASDCCSLLALLVTLLRINKDENLSLSELGNFKLSSLVESLLKKFADLSSDCKKKLQELNPDVFNRLFQSIQDNEARISSPALDAEARKLKARQRQAAILAKMGAAQSKFLEHVKAEPDDPEAGRDEQTGEGCVESNEICSLCHDSSSKSPVSFLVLLQKSRLLSFVDRGPPIWAQDGGQSDKGKVDETANSVTESSQSDETEPSKHSLPSSELKLLVRDAVNEFSCGGCPAEVESFVDYLKKQIPDVRIASVPSTHGYYRESAEYPIESLEQDLCSLIQKQMIVAVSGSLSIEDGSIESPEEGLQKYINIDTILLGKYLASLKKKSADISSPTRDSGLRNEPNVKVLSYDGFGPTSCDGIHLSSCGHAVHQRCLDRYLSSLKDRHNRRMIFEGGHIIDPEQGEFLCPVCRRMVNSVLPADPRAHRSPQPVDINRGLSSPSYTLKSDKQEAVFYFQNALHLLKSAASAVSKGEIVKTYPMHSRDIMPDVGPFSELLCGMYFPRTKDPFLRTGRVSPSLVMWDTLKYSLVSTEIAARRMSGTNSASGCSSLDSELKSSGGFILSLMLRLVQSTKSKSSVDMYLRFRSIMLFSASICCDSNFGGSFGHSSRQEGKIMRIMKHIDADLSFPDTQFWNRASDPVISRDSFSTLMWILFCLPCQIMWQKESLFSLLHLFYAVNITQGVITYCVKHGRKMADLSHGDCLLTDIAKLVAESGITNEQFACNYNDPSCNIKDYVRLLSLPFLRRCVLLCKLLKDSISAQSLGADCSYETSLNCVPGLDTSRFQDDLDEVSKLENIFKIPPLDDILGDEHLRSLVPKWIYHFQEKFQSCNTQSVLYLTPAVPFQLMHLPFVYQDLLERCIKPRCPNCNTIIAEPLLCLLCGRLCSPTWKNCCRQSGCQSHAISCGAGTGVFLMVKNTSILLQRNARRALWPSPYLDAFGEEDPEIRRGKPLYLNVDRYSALNYMVASHGLDRSSKVLRHTTTTTFFVA